jgi:SP family arabinose:H+ symporter-like MFS transporter
MTIGLALLVSQQFSGQPSILSYSRVLFEAVGLKGHASVVTVIIMGLTSIMTVSLVDRVGRKVLLLSGCAIMALSLLALSIGFWSFDEDAPQLAKWQQRMVLWSMFVFIAGFQVGYGPITWTVLSEIYPSEIRGTAMALSVEVNFFFKFVVQLCFPLLQGALGWKYTFISFCCLGFASFVFILLKVPETKGLSLEEIQSGIAITECKVLASAS